ncbi:glycosyltransferase family 2 protein [Candidatus Hakubella thermalkaliphila]|uniref:glycosyltransferase family 2 protein n=1 Tax=Candidatus Hakubella thermalkaliphila TaxID=2754717 RepID=UPI002158D2B2|nr:glycosyltransferase family 2 protein [Candidatus Hakubella thermalkaliphila]
MSVFFPVYNDWGTIGSMVVTAISVLDRVARDYEIILVDDGSQAQTRGILEKINLFSDRVRVVYHERNQGYGRAIRTGIQESKYQYIFYTDADAQYDARELELLLPSMTEGVDIVNGYKIRRSDPLYRVIIGKLYHHITRLMFRFPIRDIDCDFRLMRKSIFDQVELESNSGVICVEMITKIHRAGFRFAEVGVHHYFRTSGKSQFFTFRRVFRVGIDLLKLWWKLVIRREESRRGRAGELL